MGVARDTPTLRPSSLFPPPSLPPLRCAAGDLTKERGAVMEEWRMNRDSNGRSQEAHWKLILQGSKWVDPFPDPDPFLDPGTDLYPAGAEEGPLEAHPAGINVGRSVSVSGPMAFFNAIYTSCSSSGMPTACPLGWRRSSAASRPLPSRPSMNAGTAPRTWRWSLWGTWRMQVRFGGCGG